MLLGLLKSVGKSPASDWPPGQSVGLIKAPWHPCTLSLGGEIWMPVKSRLEHESMSDLSLTIRLKTLREKTEGLIWDSNIRSLGDT